MIERVWKKCCPPVSLCLPQSLSLKLSALQTRYASFATLRPFHLPLYMYRTSISGTAILYFLYLIFSTLSYYTCSLHRGFSAFNIALDSTYMYPSFTCDYIGGVQYKLGGLLHSRTYLLLYHVTHYAIMETEWPCGSEWLS